MLVSMLYDLLGILSQTSSWIDSRFLSWPMLQIFSITGALCCSGFWLSAAVLIASTLGSKPPRLEQSSDRLTAHVADDLVAEVILSVPAELQGLDVRLQLDGQRERVLARVISPFLSASRPFLLVSRPPPPFNKTSHRRSCLLSLGKQIHTSDICPA